MFPPLFLDGIEELVAILVGGDDWFRAGCY